MKYWIVEFWIAVQGCISSIMDDCCDGVISDAIQHCMVSDIWQASEALSISEYPYFPFHVFTIQRCTTENRLPLLTTFRSISSFNPFLVLLLAFSSLTFTFLYNSFHFHSIFFSTFPPDFYPSQPWPPKFRRTVVLSDGWYFCRVRILFRPRCAW